MSDELRPLDKTIHTDGCECRASKTTSDLRAELIQVAAVAVAIITDLDQGSTVMLNPDNHRQSTKAHDRAMLEVQQERGNQERKWGAQHHSIERWLVILGEEYGEACQAALEEVIFPALLEWNKDG